MNRSLSTQTFNSPEEEIQYLREQLLRHTQQTNSNTNAEHMREVVKQHAELPMSVLEKGYRMMEPEVRTEAALLSQKYAQEERVNDGAQNNSAIYETKNSLRADEQRIQREKAAGLQTNENIGNKNSSGENTVEGLMNIVQIKGIRNALAVVEKMDNPFLEDELHRRIISELQQGVSLHSLSAEKVTKDIGDALTMVLYEVSFPIGGIAGQNEKAKTQKEILSVMEQFLSGIISLARDDQYVVFEIANAHGSKHVVFYIAIPIQHTEILEKQLGAFYPQAQLTRVPQDYNIFNPQGAVVAGYAHPLSKAIYPIKTYTDFDHDPLSVIVNTFSKLDEHLEGAAVQFVIKPVGNTYQKKYEEAIRLIEKGYPLKYATDVKDTATGELFKSIKDIFSDPKKKEGGKDGGAEKNNAVKDIGQKNHAEQVALEQIRVKINTPIMLTNIRIVACAQHEQRAKDIWKSIEAGFHQFTNTQGNGISVAQVKRGALKMIEREYIFREFSFEHRFPLSLREIATVAHFVQGEGQVTTPELKTASSKTAPIPLNISKDGILLGINGHQGIDTEVRMAEEDRMRHMYVIGQTGTGKSTFIKNMAIEDILRGDGVCFIDPHGVDVQDILAAVPPERREDVIYFDPSYTARPMALNMLEYDVRYPEQKTFVVNEMLSIFNKLFDMQAAGGPMFEQYFRNATLLVMEDPESGSTLLDITRVLADKEFRTLKLSRCKNPLVVQFWRDVAEKAGGDGALANMVPYITSKFDVFLSNDIMRPIVAREKSVFNFRDIMDKRKILLVNLAKGRLGDINANLIGLILVGKILMAALSRVDSFGQKLADFYLYIDEFQNVTTPSIATILSEARKYRLSLTVAHQFIAQLDQKTKDAVFGNVGSLASFRVGAEDAEFLAKQYAPTFGVNDLMNIENRHALLKMLVQGQPVRPFNIRTMPPRELHRETLESLKQASYMKFGVPREEIEQEIAKRYGLGG